MKRIVTIIIIILITFNLMADQNTNVALHYYIQAKPLFDNKKYENAKKLLIKSIEFDPHFSESLYLLAQIYLAKQETTAIGLDYLSQALNANSWIIKKPVEAKQDLAETYIQIKKYQEALIVIQEIKSKYISDPFLEILKAKAFIGLNDFNSAIIVLKDALALFPKTPEIYLIYINFLLKLNLEYDANVLINQALSEFPNSADFIYYLIILEKDNEKRIKLINQYYTGGG